MGTFSIWHWLIVILVLFGWFGPLLFVSKERKLCRKPFAIRNAIVFAILGALGVLIQFLPEQFIGVLAISGIVAIPVLLTYAIYRTQDIGWSRWTNLILLVPYVQVAWLAMLLTMRGKSNET